VLADSEVPKFWKAFDELNPVRGAALKAILLLGQRPGEICNMRYEHIKKQRRLVGIAGCSDPQNLAGDKERRKPSRLDNATGASLAGRTARR